MNQNDSPSVVTLDSISRDLYFGTLPWMDREKLILSDIDVLIRNKWETALSKNVFLHGVESEPRRMCGRKGFVAVLCRNRANHKRKPQSFTSILQEVDPNSFNFTKVKPSEILFFVEEEYVANNTSDEDITSAISEKADMSTSTCKKTAVIINNSPYEYAHCLLVPNINECQIQSINFSAIRMGIMFLLSSPHPGFRLMYNSLCAGASINHLHMHCYYTEYWLPSEAFQMNQITGNGGKEISDFFELDFSDVGVRGLGFVITIENYNFKLPNMVQSIVRYFNANNISHNIVIIRGIPPSSNYVVSLDSEDDRKQSNKASENVLENPNIPIIEESAPYSNREHIPAILRSSPLVGRLYIFPRLPLYGEKCYRKFHVNVTELFGHLYFGDVGVYESMNENDVVRALNSVSFSKKQFDEVKHDIADILSHL